MADALPGEIRRLAREARLEPLSPSRFAGADALQALVVSVIRDERTRLPDFLDHYRSLGAAHFLFVDNDSADGSSEFLAAQPDVDLFATDAPFSAAAKHGWISRLVEQYGDRWYLLADADEHAVFHGVEDLAALALAAERAGRRRIRAALIDMYGDTPVAAAGRAEGQSLQDAFPYFDADGYVEEREIALTTRVGGPRRRLFSTIDPSFAPQLTKYPLFRLRPGDTLVSPHYIDPPLAGEDPCWIALLHFKFDSDTPARIVEAVERRQYWQNSYEYRVYQRALERDPELSFMADCSRRFRGPAELVDLGIIDEVTPGCGPSLVNWLSALIPGRNPRK